MVTRPRMIVCFLEVHRHKNACMRSSWYRHGPMSSKVFTYNLNLTKKEHATLFSQFLHTSPHHRSFLHQSSSTSYRPPSNRPPDSLSTKRTEHRRQQKFRPPQPSTNSNPPFSTQSIPLV